MNDEAAQTPAALLASLNIDCRTRAWPDALRQGVSRATIAPARDNR